MGIEDLKKFFEKRREENNQARIDDKYPPEHDPRADECDALIKTLNEQFKQTNERLKAVK